MSAIISRSPPVPAPDTPDTEDTAGVSRLVVRVAIALAILPLVVSAIVVLVHVGTGFHAVSDNALNELRTHDVGRHSVLIGPYSRNDWNHPGPAMYYVLAVPYWLTGGNSIGLMLGALLVNGAAIVGMALVARRVGGLPVVLLVLVGCGLLVRALGADLVSDPWNPYITVLPFGLFVLLAWALTCGEAWALPLAVAVASFCVQTHVGYAPLAIPLLLWGAGWLAVLEWRGRRAEAPALDRPRNLGRWTALAIAVLVVMWLPPVLDQLLHSPGNLNRVLEYFRNPPDKAHTLADGYRVVTAQFGRTPGWVTGASKPNPFSGEPDYLSHGVVPLLLVPFVGAVVVLWRRRAADGLRLAATVIAGLGLGVVAVARTTGPAYIYRLRWTWILAMLAAVVVMWTAWTMASGARRRLESRWLVPLSMSVLVVLAAVNTVGAVTADDPGEPFASRLSRLIPRVMAALPPSHGDVIIRGAAFSDGAYTSGLILALERRGVATRVDTVGPSDQTFGSHRVHRTGPVRAALYVVADANVQPMLARPDRRLVAYEGTVSLRERTRLASRLSALAAASKAGTLDPRTYLTEAAALGKRLGSAAAVFIAVPGPPGR